MLWGFCDFGESVKSVLKSLFDGKIDGVFRNQSEILSVIDGLKMPQVFITFLKNLAERISFEGELSFGGVFASTLSWGVVKVCSFLIVFALSQILLKIVFYLVLKFTNKNSLLRFGDRLFGGVVGVLKGVVLFGIIYFLTMQLANITLNDELLKVLQNSMVVSAVYDKVVFPLAGNLFAGVWA